MQDEGVRPLICVLSSDDPTKYNVFSLRTICEDEARQILAITGSRRKVNSVLRQIPVISGEP